MNQGKKIKDLPEATEIPAESRFVVEMGDGTGTKQVKQKTLIEQVLQATELTYEETLTILNTEGDVM